MMLCLITPQRAKSLFDHKSFPFHKKISISFVVTYIFSSVFKVNETYENEIGSETSSSSGKNLIHACH